MLRSFIAQIICLMVILSAFPLPAAAKSAGKKVSKVQTQLTSMPVGTIIEVTNNEGGSIRGRLGELKSDSFELQQTKGTNIEKRSFRFDEVSHVRQVDREKSKHGVRNGVLIAVVAVGAVMAITVGMCASGKCH